MRRTTGTTLLRIWILETNSARFIRCCVLDRQKKFRMIFPDSTRLRKELMMTTTVQLKVTPDRLFWDHFWGHFQDFFRRQNNANRWKRFWEKVASLIFPITFFWDNLSRWKFTQTNYLPLGYFWSMKTLVWNPMSNFTEQPKKPFLCVFEN